MSQMIPLTQAAQLLGISTDTLRKRVQRGTYNAQKVEGRWFIALPDVQDTGCPPGAGSGLVVQDKAGEVSSELDRLRIENRLLKAQLDQKDALIKELFAQALAAKPPEALPQPAKPEQPEEPQRRRLWWKLWR